MIANLNKKSNLFFVKSIVIAMILTLTIIPILLLLTEVNTNWVTMATLLWCMGSIIVFHPFVLYVYPHLMSKTSLYLLTSILIVVSAWLNITMITLLLPNNYIYYSIFTTTLSQISLFGSLYVIFLNTIITRIALSPNIDFYTEERLF